MIRTNAKYHHRQSIEADMPWWCSHWPERITVLAQGTPLVETHPTTSRPPKVREAYLGDPKDAA